MKKFKIAVVGAGYMGRNHIRTFRSFDDVDLMAVVEPDVKTAKTINRIYGIKVYPSLKQILKLYRIDIVSIASPTSTHYVLASQTLRAGIASFVEKPITETVQQGQKLIKLSEEYKSPLMVGHIERFNPAIVELKRRLKDNQLGKIFEIRSERRGSFPERISDVGVVIDLATHDIDLYEYLLETKVVSIKAVTKKCFHPKHEDYVVSLMDLKNGATGVLNVNWITPTKIRKLQITGEYGMFSINLLTQALYFYKNNMSKINWEQMEVFKSVSEGDMTKIKIDLYEPLALELRSFVDAVKNRQPIPVEGKTGLRALKIAHAMIVSGKTNRKVRID